MEATKLQSIMNIVSIFGIWDEDDFGSSFWKNIINENIINMLYRSIRNEYVPDLHYKILNVCSIHVRKLINKAIICINFIYFIEVRYFICSENLNGTNILFLIYTWPKNVKATIIIPINTNMNLIPT